MLGGTVPAAARPRSAQETALRGVTRPPQTLQARLRMTALRATLASTVLVAARPRRVPGTVLWVDTRMRQVPLVLRLTTALRVPTGGTVLVVARPRSAQAAVLWVDTRMPHALSAGCTVLFFFLGCLELMSSNCSLTWIVSKVVVVGGVVSFGCFRER